MRPSWAGRSPCPCSTNCGGRAFCWVSEPRCCVRRRSWYSGTWQWVSCCRECPSIGTAPSSRWVHAFVRGCVALPYFAAREEMALQLPHPASHCQDVWMKRLWGPARLRPAARGLFPPPARR